MTEFKDIFNEEDEDEIDEDIRPTYSPSDTIIKAIQIRHAKIGC